MIQLLPLFEAAIHKTKVVWTRTADEAKWQPKKRARSGTASPKARKPKAPKLSTHLKGRHLFERVCYHFPFPHTDIIGLLFCIYM
jgi:hypothetical protein